jgi:hypothetical protein
MMVDPILSLFHSYIANLNPSYIRALSETAPEHQVPALRDAIWKHVALQSSIGIKIPVSAIFVSLLAQIDGIRPLTLHPFPSFRPVGIKSSN